MNTRPRSRWHLCPACSKPHGRSVGWRYCYECQREYDQWRKKKPRSCGHCGAGLKATTTHWLCSPCRRIYEANKHPQRRPCTVCGEPANKQHSQCGHCRHLARTGKLKKIQESIASFR